MLWTSPKAFKPKKVLINLNNCKLHITHVDKWLAKGNVKQKVYLNGGCLSKKTQQV